MNRFLLVLTAAVFSFGISIRAQAQPDDMLRNFQAPPDIAKPRTWWYWMNGNITQEGIRRDLEWMKRIGIGGVLVLETSFTAPRTVEKPLVYMSEGWKDAFRYAASLTDRFGMELAIHSSPGWSTTGGPWVKPHQAMKKFVWSVTPVQGGQVFKGKLALPPATTGPFQDIEQRLEPFETKVELPRFYADAAVIAYRLPDSAPAPRPVSVTTSTGPIDTTLLEDGDLDRSVSVPASGGTAWLQLAYDRPQTIRAAVLGAGPHTLAALEAQDAKGVYRAVASLVPTSGPMTSGQTTVSFNPVTAKVFRFVFTAPPSRAGRVPGVDTSLMGELFLPHPAVPQAFSISELSLQGARRVHEFERKAGFATAEDYYAIDTPTEGEDVVRATDVLDLSSKMTPDGMLEWDPPSGRWAVLRLGYSLTGEANRVAMAQATGLEVDKLNRRHVQAYMKDYLDAFADFLSPSLMSVHGLSGVETDSVEIGNQNWTEDMLAQFQRLRGYDPRPWLPALTGIVVESPRASDKFLWDFRRTIAQLIAEQHYAEVAARAHARGLKHYSEAFEFGRPMLGDDMEMRRYSDVPKGAMWTYPLEKGPRPELVADIRGAASVAHLYGRQLAAAESFTNSNEPWTHAPRDLKPVADLEFAHGINRIFVHTSTHQPDERAPGLTLGFFGTHFSRHETWAEQAGPWMSYLARSSYLLQQGRFVADVAYFYGEEAPLTMLQRRGRLEGLPHEYAYDFVNSDALLHLLEVQDGHLTTPSGMQYRVLQLGGASRRMTVAVLRKIERLVRNGAIVVGAPPIDTPSLADDEAEFQRLTAGLWGADGAGVRLGRGRVYGKAPVEEALSSQGVAPDLMYSRPHADTELLFVHRVASDAEIYYLTNRKDRAESLEVSFRITGRKPELWRAETGRAEPVSFRMEGDRTIVPLDLTAFDAVFVVFRKPASETMLTVPRVKRAVLASVEGPWEVRFQEHRGAPSSVRFDDLLSWDKSAIAGVKYFSGSGTYLKTIYAPKSWFTPGARLMLDLGEVRELAMVSINGKALGVLWNPPYQVDVTDVLRSGANRLEVKVTNLWVNRLIGDRQPGAQKQTFTTVPSYTADAPLRPSGLLGPITIQRLSDVGE